MADKLSERAPYATTTSIIMVLEKQRRVGLDRIDATTLERMGIPESLRPRTIASLALLGFTEADGSASPEFARLKSVKDDEYKSAIWDILETVYEPVLGMLGNHLSDITTTDVSNALRGYEPVGQLERMVQLFVGLMVYVDRMPEQGRRKGSDRATAPNGRQRSSQKQAPVVRTNEQPLVTPLHETKKDPQALFARTVSLGEAVGSLTLSSNVNPLALTSATRDFFFQLVDLMEEYESSHRSHEATGTRSAGGDHA